MPVDDPRAVEVVGRDLDPDLVNRYTTRIAGRREFPTDSICDPHLVLHGRSVEASTMCTGHSTAGREPTMDTERDIIIDTDDRSVAEAFAAGDPFNKGGLFQEVKVVQWRKSFFNFENCM